MHLTGNTRNIFIEIAQGEPDALNDLAIKDIASACGISERTVRRHIKALRALNLIDYGRLCPGLTYSYSVNQRARNILRV